MRLAPTLLALTLAFPVARGDEPSLAGDLRPWSFLGENVAGSFQGTNLLLQVGGVGATWILATQGVDESVRTTFRDHPAWGTLGAPAVALDALGPILLVGGLWGAGRARGDTELTVASYAVLQSSVLAMTWVGVLKAVTGRPPPDPRSSRDESQTFRFGFLRGGVFWGWPSGHTAMAASMASTLIAFYPRSFWMKLAGLGWVAYTALSVSSFERGGMHWLSDAVAGGLMSWAIGSTVGARFRAALGPGGAEAPTLAVLPGSAAGVPTLNLAVRF
jgi:membrane-associated phospholipid phosphatase